MSNYVAEFAKYFHRDPAELDLEAVRQYQLYLSQERKLSPQSINTFVSAVQFLYLVTLELPWEKHDFPRARLEEKLPIVLAPDDVQRFLDHIAGQSDGAPDVWSTCPDRGSTAETRIVVPEAGEYFTLQSEFEKT